MSTERESYERAWHERRSGETRAMMTSPETRWQAQCREVRALDIGQETAPYATADGDSVVSVCRDAATYTVTVAILGHGVERTVVRSQACESIEEVEGALSALGPFV